MKTVCRQGSSRPHLLRALPQVAGDEALRQAAPEVPEEALLRQGLRGGGAQGQEGGGQDGGRRRGAGAGRPQGQRRREGRQGQEEEGQEGGGKGQEGGRGPVLVVTDRVTDEGIDRIPGHLDTRISSRVAYQA